MHNVDFESNPSTYIIFKFTMLSTQILFHSYLGQIFVHRADKCHVMRTLLKYMTYLNTFRIFVQTNTIFMHNVDFESNPYNLYNI